MAIQPRPQQIVDHIVRVSTNTPQFGARYMQINMLIQNSCKYGMRVAIPRVHIHKYVSSIVMPVEHSYTQVMG